MSGTGKNAAEDQLLRFEHILVFVNARKHQLTDDQQRPVISHNVQGPGNRSVVYVRFWQPSRPVTQMSQAP